VVVVANAVGHAFRSTRGFFVAMLLRVQRVEIRAADPLADQRGAGARRVRPRGC